RLFPGKRVEIQQGPHILRRGRDTPTPDYADGVHSDGGLDLDDYLHNIAAFASPEAARWWRSLYERPSVSGLVWIDFWRTTNMNGPLQHMPLALCDPTSVEPADLVPVAMTGIAPQARQSRHLCLRFDAQQRWYYYPHMTTDELLAFKLAEFWKESTPVRNCFHSAFPHPDTPTNAEKRQSCEHRVAVLVLAD
ncbi:MAG TPA: CmcJ/NvfI family oxidoreductase, partial [Sphingomicrobium sp.]|nr:CmcJ/NvfI family oxidoreductase [Sphingomicrobium sp.]